MIRSQALPSLVSDGLTPIAARVPEQRSASSEFEVCFLETQVPGGRDSAFFQNVSVCPESLNLDDGDCCSRLANVTLNTRDQPYEATEPPILSEEDRALVVGGDLEDLGDEREQRSASGEEMSINRADLYAKTTLPISITPEFSMQVPHHTSPPIESVETSDVRSVFAELTNDQAEAFRTTASVTTPLFSEKLSSHRVDNGVTYLARIQSTEFNLGEARVDLANSSDSHGVTELAVPGELPRMDAAGEETDLATPRQWGSSFRPASASIVGLQPHTGRRDIINPSDEDRGAQLRKRDFSASDFPNIDNATSESRRFELYDNVDQMSTNLIGATMAEPHFGDRLPQFTQQPNAYELPGRGTAGGYPLIVKDVKLPFSHESAAAEGSSILVRAMDSGSFENNGDASASSERRQDIQSMVNPSRKTEMASNFLRFESDTKLLNPLSAKPVLSSGNRATLYATIDSVGYEVSELSGELHGKPELSAFPPALYRDSKDSLDPIHGSVSGSIELVHSQEPKQLAQYSSLLNYSATAAHRISAQLALHLKPLRDGAVEVSLSPVEFGKVRMFVATTDRLSIHLVAERPEVLDFLRKHSDILHRELRDSGLGDASVTFEYGGDRGRGQSQYSGFQGDSLSEAVEIWDEAIAGEEVMKATPKPVDRLDIRF
ncbi:flagellar hook-length control protein FliK [Paracoccus aminophilus]|uniref:Flagellar hook-length control protein n=1 Tax=Paracoccus aminophilus JCM 7686 TaxID=1367847 RepID=S5XPH9_PARAH|nr:flagellar hook-length control protein FliK [Paracoccus aminophilus]AGT09244.1 flagellar hook-length control protein [Paracoccus aminophilus JCM 7686]